MCNCNGKNSLDNQRYLALKYYNATKIKTAVYQLPNVPGYSFAEKDNLPPNSIVIWSMN